MKTLANRRSSNASISQMWNQENGPVFYPISANSVQRIRKQLKFKFKPPKIRQKLTEDQIKKRYVFAHSMLGSEIDHNTIIFSDESRICLVPGNRYIWYQPGELTDDVFQETYKVSDWWYEAQ